MFVSKLILSIWLLGLSCLTTVALPKGFAGITVRAIHCLQSVSAFSFDYDQRIQAHIDYDGSSKGIFDYDGAEVRTANECASQSASSHALFATSANFLAAESGALSPAYEEALQGNATPRGWPDGVEDAAKHNAGKTENSVFTSWTTDPTMAQAIATLRGEGVVLQYEAPLSSLIRSPDVFNESEVLIKGTVTGAMPTQVKGF